MSLILKEEVISEINSLIDRTADENIDTALDQLKQIIWNMDTFSFETMETTIDSLHEKLKKARKEKKRWKRKYLKLIASSEANDYYKWSA